MLSSSTLITHAENVKCIRVDIVKKLLLFKKKFFSMLARRSKKILIQFQKYFPNKSYFKRSGKDAVRENTDSYG